MILKWLKKHLPKHHEISKDKSLSWFGNAIHKKDLWHLTRHSVSVGVSVGLFVAFIPLPIQMICATALSILLRGNIMIAIAATFISNPLTFLPINYFIYKVGQFFTNDPSEFQSIQELDLHGADMWDLMSQFFTWLQSLGKSILIGTTIVSVTAALLGYILVNVFWKLIISRHKIHKKNPKK